MHDKQEHWLVQFITLCTGGETASQIKGIDQLREVAWELLTKGRGESLKKITLRIFATLMRKMTMRVSKKNKKNNKEKKMKQKTVKKWGERERASSF